MGSDKRTVIFDIGGVIAFDVWEPMFLDPVKGMAAKFDISLERARSVGERLWGKYSVIPGDPFVLESMYWKEAINLLELPLGVDFCVDWSNDFIRPVEGVGDLVEDLLSGGVNVAVCSNNTEFWFLKQYQKIDCLRRIGRRSMALSFEVGETKDSSPHRMFAVADEKSSAHPDLEVIYVDDRSKNVAAARLHGYYPVLFESAPQLRGFLRGVNYI